MRESELILNEDGSIYHLNILPEDLAETIITVGDPDRVGEVSKLFDRIELKKGKREFITHTGIYKGKRISVISTGIGTDNIDIVFNELDALVNIDLNSRKVKNKKTALEIVRIGTSGCLQGDYPVDSILLSTFGLGLDGLMGYYDYEQSEEEKELTNQLKEHNAAFFNSLPVKPYFAQASSKLINQFKGVNTYSGITTTCTGFYGPQGRSLRLKPKLTNLLDNLKTLKLGDNIVTNFEMETAGIYGLANALRHKALSVNLLIANRATGDFSENPKESMKTMIQWALDKLIS